MGLIELRPDEPFVFMKVGRHAGARSLSGSSENWSALG
jgi:hypothetical protein